MFRQRGSYGVAKNGLPGTSRSSLYCKNAYLVTPTFKTPGKVNTSGEFFGKMWARGHGVVSFSVTNGTCNVIPPSSGDRRCL